MPGKRIVILVAGLPPAYNGGTEIATTYTAKYAVKAGHEVHVIALGSGSGKYQSKDGYHVHMVRTVRVPYLYGLVGLLGVVFKVGIINPDVIHAQGTQMALSAFICSLIYEIPYIFYGRGEIYVKFFLKKFLTKLFMYFAYRVIAQTEHMKKEMLRYLKRDIEVIPNGIEMDCVNAYYHKICTREQARKWLALRDDLKVVLFVGRLRPEKNARAFIEAMGFIKDANIIGLIIGDGGQFEELKKLAKDLPVGFAGNQVNDVARIFMLASDVLVNTSTSEGFPVTLLEGMAAGLPIVAPDVTGIKEIIEPFKNGYLTNNSPKSISTAISVVLNNDHSFMGIENKAKAREYTWEKVIEKLY